MTTTTEKGMDQKTFENTLRAYKRNTKAGKELARKLANAAIVHFSLHGDLRYAQAFNDAMDANYSRKPAFLAWLYAHAPVAQKDGKLVKDKSEQAVAFNVAGALAKPFWDYLPEKQFQPITETDVVIILERAIARMEKAEATPIVDEAGNKTARITAKAVQLIPEMKDFVEKLREDAGLPAVATAATTEEDGLPPIDTSEPTDEEVEQTVKATFPEAAVA